MDEQIIGQLGLILTQLRYTRRALEDVERSTARFSGLGVSGALQGGARFTDPPLQDGALKVFVVNINDLSPGGGFGNLFEGLLGGIGRFFGGFFGGIVGGTLGGVALPMLLDRILRIAESFLRILDRLGIKVESPAANDKDKDKKPADAVADAAKDKDKDKSGNLSDTLSQVSELVTNLTNLFDVAAGEKKTTATAGPTDAFAKWLPMLESARGLLAGISHVIDGLILLVPILVGALATIVVRLDSLKLALLGVLHFVLQNVILLRGVILTTLFDTLSTAARLASTLLGILSVAVERILSSVFSIIGTLLEAALQALAFLASGLAKTVNGLLGWVVTTIFSLLNTLGNTFVFRVLVHVIQVLPAILPPIFELATDSSMGGDARQALTDASKKAIDVSKPTGASAPLPAFPDLASALVPPDKVAELSGVLSTATKTVSAEVKNVFGTAGGAFANFGKGLNAAARDQATYGATLDARLKEVGTHSAELAKALQPAEDAAAKGAPTGLEAIATAYEQWLKQGGMTTLLNNLTNHFKDAPPTDGVLKKVVEGSPEYERMKTDRPRATVDIQDVVIKVDPPPGADARPAAAEPVTEIPQDVLLKALRRLQHELEERGHTPDAGSPLLQLA